MKRLFLITALLVSMAGSAFAQKLNVVTTTSDLASLTREIGGDRVDITAIAKGYQDPHFVEAKPSFLLLLRKADLLEVVGLELEIGWLPPLLEQSRNPKIRPGNAGGPIFRNRTFFFANYEGLQQRVSQTITNEVPSAAFRDRR